MEVETLKLLADISPWLSFALLTVCTVIWFRLRTGTSYGLLNRLYAIVIGGGAFHDNSVTDFWHERQDVERFNALFNTRAKSLKEVNQFIKWIERNDLDIQKLANLNELFDMEKREVKKGCYCITTIFFSIIVFLFGIASLCLFGLSVKNAALIKFNDETQWMWVNHDAAYSVTFNPIYEQGQDWRLTADTCTKTKIDTESLSAQTKLKPENILNICESFTNEKDKKFIDNVIKNQKSFIWPALSLLLLGLYSFNSALQMKSAHDAKVYLNKKLGKN
ncbi:DUF6216 family protein [Aeromonas veronii]|uniref:DUF6216 family protein n=1 Tax=Aeromonas veronii TaxID=654 RepID=UPI0029373ECF|nr:DUF6216 family protein [Aeromonas veronii]WOE84857.1 DUF6216 family protein [Aeromonas veronii]